MPAITIRPKARPKPPVWRWVLLGVAVCCLVNLLLFGWFYSKTYPRTSMLGQPVGNTSFNALTAQAERVGLPATLTLTYANKTHRVSRTALGAQLQAGALPNEARKQRSWLPVVAVFTRHTIRVPIAMQSQTYKQQAVGLAAVFRQEPVSAHIVQKEQGFEAVPAKAGYRLDVLGLQQRIVAAVASGTATLAVPTQVVAAPKAAVDPVRTVQDLQAQLDTPVVLSYSGKSVTVSQQDKLAWFVADGAGYTLSVSKVFATILEAGIKLGVSPKNVSQLAADIVAASTRHKATALTLLPAETTKTFTYCTAVRGVDAAYAGALGTLASQTFRDPRGWNLNGQVVFVQADHGCDFTLWLSAADQMPSFGAICDALWSCNVGANVVINFDRWQGATSTWNAAKAGSIDEYRSMAINHETGHWLGFGHSTCPAAGQPALVMQQQSIDLQGCTFNAWPTAAERQALKLRLGL